MNFQDYAIPKEDHLPFAKVMAFIAQIDGEVTIEEKQAIDSVVLAWSLDKPAAEEVYKVLENGASLKSLILEFNNLKSSYLLIQELITLTYIDGSYGVDEQKVIRVISVLCGISETRVNQIEEWVKDGIAWRERGITLITPEG